MQQQCTAAPGELEKEALAAVLSGIHSWLEKRSNWLEMRIANQHRSAIKEELGAMKFRSHNGKEY